MELEIKCLECEKRTMRFEIGPAAYSSDSDSDEIITKEVIAYESKNSKISKYSIYAFALLLIFLMAFILLKK